MTEAAHNPAEDTNAVSTDGIEKLPLQASDAATRAAVAADHGKRDLIGMSREELGVALAGLGEKPFRVKQVWQWIYNRGVTDFAAMSNLSKDLRSKLDEHFVIRRPTKQVEQTSEDGTRKWLMRFADGKEAETVYIPDADQTRGSVCISSQVGCTLTCKFCHTGTQLLVRNLSAAEIVGQFMLARDSYGEWPSPTDESRLLSNIVMMGMGEPLYNYDNVVKALKILVDGDGIALSRRRITLSTSGVVPEMYRLGADINVNLAVSLHAATDEIRSRIMPINKKYPLAELMKACREYPGVSNARRITFEYVMLKDVNDSDADARALAKLVKGIPCKFNLIPFNAWPGSAFECSSWNRIHRFSDLLAELGYTAPIRMPRGRDILAACGQLKSASERERKSLLKARLEAGITDDPHG